ncbi:g6155 [Coccomyxa elongata]
MKGHFFAFVTVAIACGLQARLAGAERRQVFIAAKKVWWNYAPLGQNLCSDATSSRGDHSTLYTTQGVGPSYLKARYIEYTDASFSVERTRKEEEAHLGILGPRLFAVPGDVLEIVFRNNLNTSTNIVPTGATTNSTAAAEPGQTQYYEWKIGQDAAPSGLEVTSSKLWLYRSTVDMVGDANSGLLGPLIVTRAAAALPHGQPKDVAQSLIAIFQILNENDSPLLNDTLTALNLNETAGLSADDFAESNKKHSINGLLFCNARGFNITLGTKVRWHLAVEGNEVDLHNTHWHGNTLLWENHNADQLSLLAGSIRTGDMLPDNPGTWFFHCHVNDHISAGMKTVYEVVADPVNTPTAVLRASVTGGAHLTGVTRNYYMAAEKVLWDYAPLGGDACSGGLQPFSEEGLVRTENNVSAGQIGSRRYRAVYVEYTDATFSVRKNRTAEEAYLGNLGPLMRAAVGDTILVHFLNRLPQPVSVHPHGVFYNKSSEGALYADGTSGADKLDDSVMPNATHTYVWEVRDRSGPGPADASSVVWMYHSHHQEVIDTVSGLYGAIIVSRKELAREDGSPKDVDREFALMFAVAHETKTFFSAENLAVFLPGSPYSNLTGEDLDDVQLSLMDTDDSEDAADLYYAINGMIYCNLPKMVGRQGDRVRFHIFTLGTEDDLHGPSLLASSFLADGQRRESLQLIPGAMHSQDVVLDAAGDWLMQCRTTKHYDSGMSALLAVAPSAAYDALAGTKGANHMHYIRAEPVPWDFAPGGLVDLCTGEPLDSDTSIYADPAGPGLAGNITKALYRSYRDASFSERLPQPAQHGILGPILHARVGDNITVVFRNALPFAVNMQPGGGLLQLLPAGNDTGAAGGPVPPNATVTYVWGVPSAAGPGPADFSTVAYTYHSSVDTTAHENAGLIGAVVIAKQDGDEGEYVEFPLLFNIQNEGHSAMLQTNLDAAAAANRSLNTSDPNYEEANKKHSVNGYIFCNMPDIVVPEGSKLRLILIGVGGEDDMHTPGFTDLIQNTPSGASYVVELYPGAAHVVGMYADVAGRWEFRCNVQDHFMAGMKGAITITSTLGDISSGVFPSYRRHLL